MVVLLLSALVLSALAWAWLFLANGRFWRADQRLGMHALTDAPPVAVVIPARDEAETIGEVVAAHRATTYPGAVRLIVADDGSVDGTGRLAAAAGAEVLSVPPLPEGWSGKLHALHHAVAQAGAPRYLMLTDADIAHAPQTLGRLVAKAEAEDLAMVSLMARLDARGVWGGLLIPAFVFFFQKLYPFARVNDPVSRVAAAAGGCVLIRTEALGAIGGIPAIRGALIDDCTLAGAVKQTGRSIWLGLADDEVLSLRDNRRLASIWTMVARTAFTQLGHSALLLAGSVAGMALVYLAAPLAVLTWPIHSDAVVAGAGALIWAAMAVAYAPTLRLYGQPWLAGFALPMAACLYMGMTLDSARRHWAGQGGAWKGRTYPEGH